ncbi:MAG: RsmG family class I SAM-dependent methyltransferase [Candidatus Hydrogenedentota bacterium]
MNNVSNIEIRKRALQLLERETGADIERTQQLLEAYCVLILKWNAFASLVSSRDTRHLWVHIADSLSLVGLIKELGAPSPRLLDIGSGAGFPAVPLALTFPNMHASLVERSRKKAGFLENLRGKLGLKSRVTIEQGAFPDEITLENPEGWLITARAVDKPEKVWPGVREAVKKGAFFLCQWPDMPPEAESMFHVEQIIDDWTENDLRRGTLHLIRKGKA